LFTAIALVLARAPLTAPTSVPPFTVVAPPKLVAAPSVNVSAPLFTSDPVAPVIVPSVLPAATVNTVVPRLSVPPFSAPTLDVPPFRFSTPPLTVPSVAIPPTVVAPPLTVVTDAPFVIPVTPPLTLVLESVPAFTTPPLISLVSRPATFTVPRLIPPVIVAFDANRVFPAPDKEAKVVVPVTPVKYTLLEVVFRLLTAARLKPVPLIVAKPLAFTLRVAALL
jgi:hypothetical protein